MKYSKKLDEFWLFGRKYTIWKQVNRWLFATDRFVDGSRTWWLGPVFVHRKG